MPSAIQILMDEHRVIERVLASMETFLGRMDEGIEGERASLSDFVRFIKEFADRCHHGKEEDRLFQAMCDHGFSREFGPVATMLHEHGVGRGHVAALSAVAEGKGRLGEVDKEDVKLHAMAFIRLLREHIQKEDQILYPMAQNMVPRPVMEGLAAEFEEFEKNVMGAGEHQKLHDLADRLIAEFPPDSEIAAGSGPGPSCCGHG